jgi:hypothetical protein
LASVLSVTVEAFPLVKLVTEIERRGSLFKRKRNEGKEESFVAKLRRSATDLAKDPKVRRGAGRLAKDPRVQRKASDFASRAVQRLRRR